MRDQEGNPFIVTAKYDYTLDDLLEYVIKRNNGVDSLLLGIYEKISGKHIGNIKFEPIDSESQSAWVGILIGESNWRNMGVGYEVMPIAMKWLQNNLQISTFHLGVEQGNIPAMKLYEKVGFRKNLSLSKKMGSLILSI